MGTVPFRKAGGLMPVEDKNIKRTLALDEIPDSGSQVIGISDMGSLENIRRRDVINSRGEFAGYLCENGEVILFRDRLGARNIYYSIEDDSIVISTDLGWIARHVRTDPNWPYILSDYLQFQIPFSNETFFSGIKKVMPGELVHIAKGKVRREKYWDVEFGNSSFDPQHLFDLIKDAVEYRLALIDGDRFTSYLSGGIDSSSITLFSRPRECFSGFYEEEGFSEMDYIETIVSENGFIERYVPVQITERRFQEQLDKLPQILPDPCAGLGVIPQVLVAQEAARQGYEYAFTGEGGDEIFLGYNWNTVVFSLADAARSLLRDRYMVRYEPMIEKVLRDAFPTFTGGLLARGDDKLYATQRILDIWDHNEPVENNILKINLTIGLPAILTLDEQVGRYAGVEPISPLMDHHIVEYVCSIRPQDRAPIPKFMLREALKGILPEKIRTRYDKMGFPVPYQKWNWGVIRPVINSLAERKIIEIDVARHTTMDRQTWALYTIEMWFRHYFKKPATNDRPADGSAEECVDPGRPYTDGGTVIFRIRNPNVEKREG
jgi:asparagine synthase (glutamine-hydrolysing)